MAFSVGRRIRDIVGHAIGADVAEQNIEAMIKQVTDSVSARGATPDSFFYDPMNIFTGQNWVERAGGSLTSQDLRAMSKNPIIGAIVATRINQITAYTTPQSMAHQPGFVIRTEDGTAGNDAKIKEMTQFMRAAGFT